MHLPKMAEAMTRQESSISDLERCGKLDDEIIQSAQAANETFHTAILTGCGNDYVGYTCQQISHLPMLAVGSMVFDRSLDETPEHFARGIFRLRFGAAQHHVIYEAIEKQRHGSASAPLMARRPC